jgi:hypothetical protein
MGKNALIVVLAATLVWFGSAIVRLERYRYASSLNRCGNWDPLTAAKRELCLEQTKGRTSAVYDLLYGLKLL